MAEKSSARIANTNLDALSKREFLALVNALIDAVSAIAAKLDDDVAITDDDYAATVDAVVTKT